MILKSYEVENNIGSAFKFKFILIYGENIGLKEVLKKKLINFNKETEIVNIFQEDISRNKSIITDEAKNISLFAKEKIIIINQADGKVVSEMEYLLETKENVKIILISDLLDKKSKLRSLFEKKTNLATIPCYNDTDITLRRLIQNELKEYKNLSSNAVNMILNYSNLNRKTILNDIDKIKSFYDNKIISEESLEKLLNTDKNEIFESIRDAALLGNKEKLNYLLKDFTFASEDTYLYLNMINSRLIKLLDIHNINKDYNNLEVSINKSKPPIFWKDKNIILELLKKWDKKRVIEAVAYLGKIEKTIKNSNTINSLTIVKNSITNICSNSWIYF